MTQIDWLPRTHPLTPEGVVGVGPCARALGSRLLTRGDAASFLGVASPDLLVLLGPEAPWTDGVVYLGKDHSTPALWMPTTLRPSVHPDLIERAARRRGVVGPLAVLPSLDLIIPLADARTIDEQRLRQWLA